MTKTGEWIWSDQCQAVPSINRKYDQFPTQCLLDHSTNTWWRAVLHNNDVRHFTCADIGELFYNVSSADIRDTIKLVKLTVCLFRSNINRFRTWTEKKWFTSDSLEVMEKFIQIALDDEFSSRVKKLLSVRIMQNCFLMIDQWGYSEPWKIREFIFLPEWLGN